MAPDCNPGQTLGTHPWDVQAFISQEAETPEAILPQPWGQHTAA